jgi:F0F1-type ATP synthase delta subunit
LQDTASALSRFFATPCCPDPSRDPLCIDSAVGRLRDKTHQNSYGSNSSSSQYQASTKSSALDQTAKAIASLGQTLKADPKLNTILGAPTLTVSDKKQIVEELQKVAGADKADILKNFLTTLAANNRLGSLQGVCEKFGALMSAHRGEIELNITSAQVRFPTR